VGSSTEASESGKSCRVVLTVCDNKESRLMAHDGRGMRMVANRPQAAAKRVTRN
jgi:hypothetical protein